MFGVKVFLGQLWIYQAHIILIEIVGLNSLEVWKKKKNPALSFPILDCEWK